MHCAATAITPAGASSLRHFLSIFHAISLLGNFFMLSLISLVMMPLFPLILTDCDFTCFASSFSHAFFSKKYFDCASTVGNHVILEINATPICTSLSIQRMPPWTQVTNCLMHRPTFLPHPKCGISKRFIIPDLYNHVIHCVRSSNGLPRGPISPILIRQFSSANSGNLFM
jgi:hypothetical protein